MNLKEFGKDALHVLQAVAPTAATMLGGPFGPIAGAAISAALGTPDAKTTEAAILSGNPDTLVKLRQIDADLKAKNAELGIQEEQLAYADTDSARKREMTVQDWTPRLLAALIVGLYIGVQVFLLNGVVNITMRELVLRSLGTLDAALALVLGYYFGSSASSARKSETIDKLASS